MKRSVLKVLSAAAMAISMLRTAPVSAQEDTKEEVAVQNMYRLYNPNSGEHFYTSSTAEKSNLIVSGWKPEGVGWIAPVISDTPVYRLYNSNAGDHHYTKSAYEKDQLVKAGWKYEGIGWYSADSNGQPLYRQYNPNAKSGSHNYTTNQNEHNQLVSVGWKNEGISWYGVYGTPAREETAEPVIEGGWQAVEMLGPDYALGATGWLKLTNPNSLSDLISAEAVVEYKTNGSVIYTQEVELGFVKPGESIYMPVIMPNTFRVSQTIGYYTVTGYTYHASDLPSPATLYNQKDYKTTYLGTTQNGDSAPRVKFSIEGPVNTQGAAVAMFYKNGELLYDAGGMNAFETDQNGKCIVEIPCIINSDYTDIVLQLNAVHLDDSEESAAYRKQYKARPDYVDQINALLETRESNADSLSGFSEIGITEKMIEAE